MQEMSNPGMSTLLLNQLLPTLFRHLSQAMTEHPGSDGKSHE